MNPNMVESDLKQKVITISSVDKAWTGEEVKALCRKAGIKYQEGDEKNIAQFEASNQSVDREEDIVVMDGGDFTDYRKNPVLQWVHELYSEPIGAVIDIQIDKSDKTNPRMIATCLFQQVQQHARELCELVRLGYLKAVSIQFRNKPGGYKFPSDDERKVLGMGPGGVIHTAWKMIELSLCPVGMNQDALKLKSLNSKTIALLKGMRESTILLEDDINMKPEEVTKAIKDGLLEALPGLVVAVAAEITKAEKFEVPPVKPPIVESTKVETKAWTAFELAHPEIYGKPETTGLAGVNMLLEKKV